MVPILGDCATEWSTIRRPGFANRPSPSLKLLRRAKRLMVHDLLRTMPISMSYVHVEGVLWIKSVVPHEAIAYGFVLENTPRTSTNAEIAARVTSLSSSELLVADERFAVVRAHYFNANSNNIRHESWSGGRRQPESGWRVEVNPGEVGCECNYSFKNVYCVHVLFALHALGRDMNGLPGLPCTFSNNARGRSNQDFRGRAVARVRGRTRVGRALETQ